MVHYFYLIINYTQHLGHPPVRADELRGARVACVPAPPALCRRQVLLQQLEGALVLRLRACGVVWCGVCVVESSAPVLCERV